MADVALPFLCSTQKQSETQGNTANPSEHQQQRGNVHTCVHPAVSRLVAELFYVHSDLHQIQTFKTAVVQAPLS